jgi:hypothetical protein
LSEERKRKYRFCLRDIEAGTICFISEGKDVDEAARKLAEELEVEKSDITLNLEDVKIWNPKAKKWVNPKPWWEEEKEPYEWETKG